jgi:GrpB-like predicted nucleotidyltransferase (UPF0157 family)
MLLPDEQNYLDHLPPEKAHEIVVVKPYDPRLENIAKNVIQKIQTAIPNADVRFMGASALGISGQNDIDIYVLGSSDKLENWIAEIEELFGKQIKGKWQFDRDGFEVSVYAANPDDPNQKKQIEVFEKLEENPSVLRDYEKLKESMSGKTYKDYQIAKYEFYHKLLNKN